MPTENQEILDFLSERHLKVPFVPLQFTKADYQQFKQRQAHALPSSISTELRNILSKLIARHFNFKKRL